MLANLVRMRVPEGAHATANGSVRKSPWYHNGKNCKTNVTILKSDLTLPKHNANFVDGFLCLDDIDYTLMELGWGFCLLGFFAGKFPVKEAVQKFAARWTRPSRPSYHPNG